VPDPGLITRTCEAALSKARAQDVLYFFDGLSQNLRARRALRDFFEANYDTGACAGLPLVARWRELTRARGTDSRPLRKPNHDHVLCGDGLRRI
jgi:hypothetical protein